MAATALPLQQVFGLLQNELWRQQARYVLCNGISIDPESLTSLQSVYDNDKSLAAPEKVRLLTSVHAQLSHSIAPATPKAIMILNAEKKERVLFQFLGPVPLMRNLSAAAIIFLLILFTVSLSGFVNVENINRGLLQSGGGTLAVNQLFLLCCAGLGAAFSAIIQANRYIGSLTYNPIYDSSYWTHIILGIISGIILVEMLPKELFDSGTMASFGKPTLAMFGGFSTKVVYRILLRLVDTMATLVNGSGQPDGESQNSVQKLKADEVKSQVNKELAGKIAALVQQVNSKDKDSMVSDLNGMMTSLLKK